MVRSRLSLARTLSDLKLVSEDAMFICQRRILDIQAAQRLAKQYPGQITIVYYEDNAKDPVKAGKFIYT